MTAADLLIELKTRGVELRPEGDNLRYRAPSGALTPELRDAVKTRKAELLAALRDRQPAPTDYATLTSSPLVARVRAAWPWIAEHRPDLFRRICDADCGDHVARLHEAMVEASRAYEQRQQEASVRIFSRVLGAECWIAPDEATADELRRAGVTLPILLPDEAMVLGKMAESDARELFATLVKIQRTMPGARLLSSGPEAPLDA